MDVITTADHRDIAAAEDLANRIAVLGRRSDEFARLTIDMMGDQVTIALPTPDETQAAQTWKERRLARALRRVTGN